VPGNLGWDLQTLNGLRVGFADLALDERGGIKILSQDAENSNTSQTTPTIYKTGNEKKHYYTYNRTRITKRLNGCIIPGADIPGMDDKIKHS